MYDDDDDADDVNRTPDCGWNSVLDHKVNLING